MLLRADTNSCAVGLFQHLGINDAAVVEDQVTYFSAIAITVAALLTFFAYGLVLTAFTLSRVSYVAPAREIGIVIGVLMGVFILKEPFGGGRLLGSSFIVLGLGLIAFSP